MKYEFVFKFRYWVPGGLSEVRDSVFSTDADDYASAVNHYNRYIYSVFKGLSSEITSIKRKRIQIPY